MLLADFILSKEGQQILAGADYFPVRADVSPRAGLASVIPQRAGVPELFISPDDLNRYTESSQKSLRISSSKWAARRGWL